jgi:hypothetical protein
MEQKYTDHVRGAVPIGDAGLLRLNTNEEQTRQQRHTKIILNKLRLKSYQFKVNYI